jgi:hypothetical protein
MLVTIRNLWLIAEVPMVLGAIRPRVTKRAIA